MNQNTTIETIREAQRLLFDLMNDGFAASGVNHVKLKAKLQDLANRLEAALLKEQPPVEQSEPKSGVWIAGQWREIREGGFCPKCSHKPGDCIAGTCAWQCFHVSLGAPQARTHIWLAPPAVIEPEPELDEFEKWAKGDGATYFSDDDARDFALEKYREIISRKGDK